MVKTSLIILLSILFLSAIKGHAWELNSYENSLLERIAAEREEVIARNNRARYEDPYRFSFRELILPATLIVVGSSSLYINAVEDFDIYIRDVTQFGQERLNFDDYLQYGPYLMLWTLDACGVKSRLQFKEQTTTLALAMAIMGAVVNTSKYTIQRQRPNSSKANSMPSGHTAMVFTGAEFLRKEFSDTSPWIGVAGYAMATTTAFMRVWNNRHWLTDTLVGAGVGILSVRAAYWIAPALNRVLWGSDLRAEQTPISASLFPYTDGVNSGVSLQMTF